MYHVCLICIGSRTDCYTSQAKNERDEGSGDDKTKDTCAPAEEIVAPAEEIDSPRSKGNSRIVCAVLPPGNV